MRTLSLLSAEGWESRAGGPHLPPARPAPCTLFPASACPPTWLLCSPRRCRVLLPVLPVPASGRGPHHPETVFLSAGAPVWGPGKVLEGPVFLTAAFPGPDTQRVPHAQEQGHGAGLLQPRPAGTGCRCLGLGAGPRPVRRAGPGAEHGARLSWGHHSALRLSLPPKERRG